MPRRVAITEKQDSPSVLAKQRQEGKEKKNIFLYAANTRTTLPLSEKSLSLIELCHFLG